MKPLRRPHPRRLRKATPAELRGTKEFLGYKVVVTGGKPDTRVARFAGVSSAEMKFVVA